MKHRMNKSRILLFTAAAFTSFDINATAINDEQMRELDDVIAWSGKYAGHSTTGNFSGEQLVNIEVLNLKKTENEKKLAEFGQHYQGLMLDNENANSSTVRLLQKELAKINLEISVSSNLNEMDTIQQARKKDEAEFFGNATCLKLLHELNTYAIRPDVYFGVNPMYHYGYMGNNRDLTILPHIAGFYHQQMVIDFSAFKNMFPMDHNPANIISDDILNERKNILEDYKKIINKYNYNRLDYASYADEVADFITKSSLLYNNAETEVLLLNKKLSKSRNKYHKKMKSLGVDPESQLKTSVPSAPVLQTGMNMLVLPFRNLMQYVPGFAYTTGSKFVSPIKEKEEQKQLLQMKFEKKSKALLEQYEEAADKRDLLKIIKQYADEFIDLIRRNGRIS